MLCPDIARGLCRGYRRAEMTEADNVVQLHVGELEKPLRLPVSVVLQPGDPKQRIIEGNREGRIVATQSRSYPGRLIFGLMQRREHPVWIAFEEIHPTLETLLARQKLGEMLANPGKGLQLVKFMVLHIVLPTSGAGHHPVKR